MSSLGTWTTPCSLCHTQWFDLGSSSNTTLAVSHELGMSPSPLDSKPVHIIFSTILSIPIAIGHPLMWHFWHSFLVRRMCTTFSTYFPRLEELQEAQKATAASSVAQTCPAFGAMLSTFESPGRLDHSRCLSPCYLSGQKRYSLCGLATMTWQPQNPKLMALHLGLRGGWGILFLVSQLFKSLAGWQSTLECHWSVGGIILSKSACSSVLLAFPWYSILSPLFTAN